MKRVLLVDDNAGVRKLLEMTLSMKEHQISHAETAEEALEIARRDLPELILMDVLMPGGMDGREAARLLKSEPPTNRCKIILLTSMEMTREEVLSVGADEYLLKPFSPLELIEKVSEILHQSR